MGFFDFLKKKDDLVDSGAFSQGIAASPEYSLPEHDQPSMMHQPMENYGPSVNLSTMGSSSMQNFQQSSPVAQPDGLQKDLQIISLKLDAIKSELDSLNQRMRNLENIAEKEQQQPQKRWY